MTEDELFTQQYKQSYLPYPFSCSTYSFHMIVIWIYGIFSIPSFQDEKFRHLYVRITPANHSDKLTEISVLGRHSTVTCLLTSNNFWTKKKLHSAAG